MLNNSDIFKFDIAQFFKYKVKLSDIELQDYNSQYRDITDEKIIMEWLNLNVILV